MITNSPRALIKLKKIQRYLSEMEQFHQDADFPYIMNKTNVLYDYFYLKSMDKRYMGTKLRLKYNELMELNPQREVFQIIEMLEKHESQLPNKHLSIIQTLLRHYKDCAGNSLINLHTENYANTK